MANRTASSTAAVNASPDRSEVSYAHRRVGASPPRSNRVRPAAHEVSRLIEQHHGDRLQRLEQSLLRLEHINLQTLALLQRLLGAAGADGAHEPKEDET